MTAEGRAARTREADALCADAFSTCGTGDRGIALVALGSLGRCQLAPHSDLDLVLLHADDVDSGECAARLWYPLWDEGRRVDHAVRSASQAASAAAGDLRVALGMLDARHLAGDPALAAQVRTAQRAAWRRDARRRLPELRLMVEHRDRLLGELAHASVPDLKESLGGLRDAVILRALVATWLVDVPRGELEGSWQALLDVRDAWHAVTHRATDRVSPDGWSELADHLRLADAEAAQRHVRGLGRRIHHLSRLTWRRVDAALGQGSSRVRGPHLVRIAPGIALSSGEVVLDRDARPERDPLLPLRASAVAAERRVSLAPATAARLARDCTPLPEPWPAGARDLFVRLLAAGPGLRTVWESLDLSGALDRLLPEWGRVRLLPHASQIHRYTVDRHLVETCIEAAELIRQVRRPDVLMVAALLHDISKDGLGDHSVAGAPVARRIAVRMGFPDEDADLIARLVRWHLLLPHLATTRDPEDPATVAQVVDAVGTGEGLTLLAVLTEADARATAPKAWSSWRAGLVAALVDRAAEDSPSDPTTAARPVLPLPRAGSDGAARLSVEIEETAAGSRVVVVASDRVGLLADVATALAMQRVQVRAARAWTQDDWAVSLWDVEETGLDARSLRERLEALAAGRLTPRVRLRPAPGALAPSVAVHPDASQRATVLEVRAADGPAVLATVYRALAELEISVGSAHVDTLGPQVVDVFYLHETGAGALADERAAEAAHAVRSALTPPDAR